MKLKSQITTAVLVFLFSFFLQISSLTADENPSPNQANSSNTANYTVERLCVADVWWIMVFDGYVLVDIYPE
ncbi:MAG: hypothetical protein SGI89_00505 [bacterium]|nr:hypothetical protein [bacterium]